MEKMERAAWSKEIRRQRLQMGMSQDELAEASGVTRKTINSIENGRSIPQQAVLDRILRALGLNDQPVESPRLQEVRLTLSTFEPLLLLLDDETRARAARDIVVLLVDAIGVRGPQSFVPPLPVIDERSAGRRVNDSHEEIFAALQGAGRATQMSVGRAAWSALLKLRENEALISKGRELFLSLASWVVSAEKAGLLDEEALHDWADKVQSISVSDDLAAVALRKIEAATSAMQDGAVPSSGEVSAARAVGGPNPPAHVPAANSPGVPSQGETIRQAQDDAYDVNQDNGE